uniref:Uncharacterized protein n=1 Tax=Arundo donax TaxID=35708 RepID=A0A0A9AVQ1_ARUDO
MASAGQMPTAITLSGKMMCHLVNSTQMLGYSIQVCYMLGVIHLPCAQLRESSRI